MSVCNACGKVKSFRSIKAMKDAGWTKLYIRLVGGSSLREATTQDFDIVSCNCDKCKKAMRARFLSYAEEIL